MKQILIFAVCLRLSVCRFALEDRQWTENDNRQNCTNICNDECQYCTEPKVCSYEQFKCGVKYHEDDVHGVMYDCAPDEVCIPAGCFCKNIFSGHLFKKKLNRYLCLSG